MKTSLGYEYFLGNLDPFCGMKVDKALYLDIENVSDFITSHKDTFQNVCLEGFDGSRMLYGENEKCQLFKVGYTFDKISRIIISSKLPKTKRVGMVVSYDGTGFFGFQSQTKARTVQKTIETILSEINGQATICHGASRTDTGVHAINQVIDFETSNQFSEDRWLYVMNRKLPSDIYVKKVFFAHPLFHSRYDVYKKEYRYILNTNEYDPLKGNYEWTVDKLDLKILRDNLAQLVGTFDFTSFCTGEKDDMQRTIYEASAFEKEGIITLVFVGGGFLHHMIRLIVFQLVQLATNKSERTIRMLLEEKSRAHTTRMAPAAGLYLANVEY